MDLRGYLAIARRWTPLAVVLAVGAGVLAYVVLSAQPRLYESSATLKLGQALSGAPMLLTSVSDRLLTEYAYRGSSLTTMQQITEALGLQTSPEELQERVTTSVQPSSTLLTVTARAADPDTAQLIANTAGERLIALSESSQSTSTIQQALRDDIANVRAEIDATRAELAELRELSNPSGNDLARMNLLEDRLVNLLVTHGDTMDRLISTGAHSLGFVSRANPPTAPIGPGPLLYAALAVFGGLLVAAGIAALVEYFDDTLRDPSDLEDATGLPVLGSVIEFTADAKRGGDNRLTTVTAPRSTLAEEYRRLRANVEIAAHSDRLRALLVTGSEPGIGIDVVAANLAVAFAESGLRVVLIDGDLRHPSIHDFFRLPNEHGLSTLLENIGMPPERVSARTRVPNLEVITSGSIARNPARALASNQVKSLLVQLQGRIDLVVMTGPPLPTYSDALVLGAELQEVLLVVARGKTGRGAVQQALDTLGIARARVLGTAFFALRSGSGPTKLEQTPPPAPEQAANRETLERTRSA